MFFSSRSYNYRAAVKRKPWFKAGHITKLHKIYIHIKKQRLRLVAVIPKKSRITTCIQNI
jgi:hypothetical protein